MLEALAGVHHAVIVVDGALALQRLELDPHRRIHAQRLQRAAGAIHPLDARLVRHHGRDGPRVVPDPGHLAPRVGAEHRSLDAEPCGVDVHGRVLGDRSVERQGLIAQERMGVRIEVAQPLGKAQSVHVERLTSGSVELPHAVEERDSGRGVAVRIVGVGRNRVAGQDAEPRLVLGLHVEHQAVVRVVQVAHAPRETRQGLFRRVRHAGHAVLHDQPDQVEQRVVVLHRRREPDDEILRVQRGIPRRDFKRRRLRAGGVGPFAQPGAVKGGPVVVRPHERHGIAARRDALRPNVHRDVGQGEEPLPRQRASVRRAVLPQPEVQVSPARAVGPGDRHASLVGLDRGDRRCGHAGRLRRARSVHGGQRARLPLSRH